MSRDDLISKAMLMYLRKYHSDYRWMVKTYKHTDGRWRIHNYRGAIFSWLNYANNGTSVLIYGAPMHEYFYGSFNNEYYHEFCFRKIEVDRVSLLNLLSQNPQPQLFGMVKDYII